MSKERLLIRPRWSLVALSIALFFAGAAHASELLIGTNLGSSERLTIAQQNSLLIDMKMAGVKLIRANIGEDERS